MSVRILIVYESKYGQTMKIAKFINDRISQQGHLVEMMNMNHLLPVAISSFDGIIVGAPIYMRNYPRSLRKWVAQHSAELNKKQSAFFSVCMAVLQKDENAQRDLLNIADAFFKATGWYPKRRKVFAGAITFKKYNVFTRFIMKSIASRQGKKLDTHQDYEFTAWSEVERFSDDFVSSLPPKDERSFEGAPI